MAEDAKPKDGLGPPLYTSYVFPFDPNDKELGGDPGGRVTTIGAGPGGPIYVVYTWPFQIQTDDINEPAPKPPPTPDPNNPQ